MTARVRGGALALALVAAASPAHAAPLIDLVEPLAGVADRPQPEYDPVAIPFGPLDAYPALDVEAAYTDNLLARDSDPVESAILRVAPRLRLLRADSVTRLELAAEADNRLALGHSDENRVDLRAFVRYRGQPSSAILYSVDAYVGRDTTDRASIDDVTDSISPIRSFRFQLGGNIAAMVAPQTAVTAGVKLVRRTFSDGEAADGSSIAQGFRDTRQIEGELSLMQGLAPGISALARISGNDRKYDELSPLATGDANRDSRGYRVGAGLALGVPEILRGSIALGYMSQSYHAPFQDVRGFSFSADLLWNPTPLTTLTLAADRRVEDNSTPQISGRTTTEARARVDHALLRNLVISAEMAFRALDFGETERKPREYAALVATEYRISQRLALTGSVRYSRRTGNLAEDRFRRFEAGIGLRITPGGY